MKCPYCNADNPQDANYCHMCGRLMRNSAIKWALFLAGIAILGGIWLIPELIDSNSNEIPSFNRSHNIDSSGDSEIIESPATILENLVEEATTNEYVNAPQVTSIYYRVIGTTAELYEYMINNGQTYMSDLNLVYHKGATIKGERCDLGELGEFIMVHWYEEGVERRGFINMKDVEEAYRQ